MNNSNFSDSNEDQRVLEIVDQYLQDREAGLGPSIAAILAQHPHLESRLRECLTGLEAMEAFADSLEDDAMKSTPSFPQFTDYEIKAELGRGGMGIVYRAHQISLGRPVALKVLPLAAVFDQKICNDSRTKLTRRRD